MKLSLFSTVLGALWAGTSAASVRQAKIHAAPKSEEERAEHAERRALAKAAQAENEEKGRELYYYYSYDYYLDGYAGENCYGKQYFHAYVQKTYVCDDYYYGYYSECDYDYYPVYDAKVTWKIVEGPNYDLSGEGYTDEYGKVYFDYYKSQYEQGKDKIEICYDYGDCIYIYSETPCCTECDFSALYVDDYNAEAGKISYDYYYTSPNFDYLYDSCGLKAYGFGYGYPSYLTVLDSESDMRDNKKQKYDPDLGTPHRSFDGVGRGKGGRKGRTWENADPQGNVLIIQDSNPKYTWPNDSILGGYMYFYFPYPVYNITLGILDIDYEDAVIYTYGKDGYNHIYVPETGDNGFWPSDSPKNYEYGIDNLAELRGVTILLLKLSSSGALTNINYCPEDYYYDYYDEKYEAMKTMADEGDVDGLFAAMTE